MVTFIKQVFGAYIKAAGSYRHPMIWTF